MRIVTLDVVPASPLRSAIEAPVTASRPSPQLMSYVNDSWSGSVMLGGTAAFGLSPLSNPGSVNVARLARSEERRVGIECLSVGVVTVGAKLLTVTVKWAE